MTDQPEAAPAPDASGSHRRQTIRRFAIGFLAVSLITVIARAIPLFDPSLQELWLRLSVLRNDLPQVSAADPAAWEQFTSRSNKELEVITHEIRQVQERRRGLWSWIAETSRRDAAALKELERVAQSDLPALIAAGPAASPLKQKAVDDALARVDDHLAGASPYSPPVRPIDEQDALARRPHEPSFLERWLLWIILVDAALVALVAILLTRRARNRSRKGRETPISSP